MLFDTIFRVEDSAYSAMAICNAAGESVSKYKEIIGGFYENYRETPRRTECFTDHLVYELTQAACAKNFLTTAQLWTNLARRYVTANNMELGNMPWFIAEFEENQPPISIKPMNLTDWSPAPSPCFIGSSQEIKVLLSVNLENLGQQTDWNIRGRVEQNPLIARCPRVHNVYRSSPSTGILIVSITLQVWYSLRNHPAVKFLGFEVHTTYL